MNAAMHGNQLPKNSDFKPFSNRLTKHTIGHGCLMWDYRVIVPLKLRTSVLNE